MPTGVGTSEEISSFRYESSSDLPHPEFTRRTGVIRSSIPTWHSDDSSVVPSSVTKQPPSRRFKHGCVKRRSSFFHRFLGARKLHCSFITPFCNRPSGIYILTGSANFLPGFPAPFCLVAVLPFSNIHNCHPGYVKFAPKKPQTGRVKLKFHQV